MAEGIAFDLVAPERLLLTTEAEMVTVPGSEGYLGVLKGHEPLITTLRAGMIDVKGLDGSDT
ncbi:MAG TPA: F0F1 ATP synthase subunit epsilon, partial [Rhizomicrobium sp.]|nr:F0F1 ATP synthase subunit epsilon [Rhizomicrobium sp.]